MVKNIELFILLVIAFVSILLVLNARTFVKQKLKPSDENIYTNIVKSVGFLVFVLCFVAIYYIK